ncbi:hypothetical protein AMR41_27470 [Hapalosiphon sp. MRB220]|nr:hypothetical protein AMR41_27470 [Hapalosiphon sp. MRB220]
MKSFGNITAINPHILLQLGLYVFTNPWIWLGIGFLVTSLAIYLIAISRMNLSYVLPIHASSYVLNAVLAWLILGEKISVLRWASTVLIAIGVLLVGVSQSKLTRHGKKRKEKNPNVMLLLGLFPFGIYLSKTWFAVIVLSLADSAGDLLLAIGMKQIGQIKIQPIGQMLRLMVKIITHPIILLGITCQAIAFFTFISVLTWADVSFVRPATALTYIFSMIGARYILKEKMVTEQLIGIMLIATGIAIHA